MTITTLARRGAGKLLAAIGLIGLVGLAFATPLAFTAQTGTVVELLLLATLGGAISFALLLIGDWLARPAARSHETEAPELPAGRHPRGRRLAPRSVGSVRTQSTAATSTGR